jgi:hypothetical protein
MVRTHPPPRFRRSGISLRNTLELLSLAFWPTTLQRSPAFLRATSPPAIEMHQLPDAEVGEAIHRS